MKVIRANTHKKNIINNISFKIGLPTTYISKIIDDIILILIFNVGTSRKLKVKNFGTFFLRKKNKRMGRNPKNKINHVISERKVITFKPAESLKNKINANSNK
jgi:integration host factor subunit alpha